MNEREDANLKGWSHMRSQVCLCVRIQKGARPFTSACGWCFFLFFLSLSRRQHCSTERKVGGREREREMVVVVVVRGRDRGEGAESRRRIDRNNNASTAVLCWR